MSGRAPFEARGTVSEGVVVTSSGAISRSALLAAERAADAGLMSELAVQFASTYTQRAMEADPEGRQAAAHFDRMRETGGFLRRAASADPIQFMPFQQKVLPFWQKTNQRWRRVVFPALDVFVFEILELG